jgi:hypothetical protein
MNKVILLVCLGMSIFVHSIESPDSSSSHSSDDNLLAKIIFSDHQTISRAQSFILGKPFQAIGDEFMVYPHYLNNDNEDEEYYIEQRDIALAHLKKLKECASADYFRLSLIESSLHMLTLIDVQKKLIPQIPIDYIIGACAFLLDKFENDFEAKPEDFDSDEQIKLVHTKNRKKFLHLLTTGAPKEQINHAGQSPLGTASLHDYFTGALAATAAMQYVHGTNQMGGIDACVFWSRLERNEKDQEKFALKLQEMAEKFKAMK